ncbi:MAG: ECF transporter S component, partial [Oscillospiraceae bacterium]|nr:ECF transporter S component [Oscillospiraceae bacterium]
MNQAKTTKLAVTALMAALIFAVTYAIRIPIPFSSGGGYLNLGDVMIYLCAYLLGGPLGAVAAAIGSGAADLAAGAAAYILPTAVIKGFMGLAAGSIMKKRGVVTYLLGSTVGAVIMTLGYALFEYFFFTREYAFAALPFNAVQG